MPADAPFRFVQFEFAFSLGPADGRYLRRTDGAEASAVIVLRTLGAPPRRMLRRRRPRRVDDAEPEPVPTVRATLIRVEPFASEESAASWLEQVRRGRDLREAELEWALHELNFVLRAHRAAAGDPYVRDVVSDTALVTRVGYGSGDLVADGHFAAAYELSRRTRRRRRREQLAPQERLAAILAGRDLLLAGEELTLRARADLDAARPREAALQARIALEVLLSELAPETEALSAAREAVGRAANAALAGDPPPDAVAAVAEAVDAMERALRRRQHVRSSMR